MKNVGKPINILNSEKTKGNKVATTGASTFLFLRSFPPAEVKYRLCQFWSKVMTSEGEQRPRLVIASCGWHGSQWVKIWIKTCVYRHYFQNSVFHW